MPDTIPPAAPASSDATGLSSDPTGVSTAMIAVVGALITLLAAFDVGTNEQRAAINGTLLALLTAGEWLWVRRHAWKPGSVRSLVNAVRAGTR